MVWEDVKTAELFDLGGEGFAPLLKAFEYPWQIVPQIAHLIEFISTNIEIDYIEAKSGVLIHKTAKISPFSEICAPAIIGAGCVVGNCCEIKNCVLLDGATLPHFNYAGDSVIGRRAHLGAGAILSNLKGDRSPVAVRMGGERVETGLKKCGSFLGDGAEVGCNAVLNPGCVVGKESRIYPLVSLRGCVPAGAIVKK